MQKKQGPHAAGQIDSSAPSVTINLRLRGNRYSTASAKLDPYQPRAVTASVAVVLPFDRDRRKRRRIQVPRLILLVIDLRRLLSLPRLTSDENALGTVKFGKELDHEYVCVAGYGRRRQIVEALYCRTARNRGLRAAIEDCLWALRDHRRPICAYLFLDSEDRPHVQDLLDRLRVWRRQHQERTEELSRLLNRT